MANLLKPYHKGFIGLMVSDVGELTTRAGSSIDFKVAVEREVFRVRTVCGMGLLYATGGEDGTENRDHPAGAKVEVVS